MNENDTEEKRTKWFEFSDILAEFLFDSATSIVKGIVHVGEILAESIQGLF